MRDLIILACIIVFWFVLGGVLTMVYSDPLVVDALIQGNSSYIISVNTNDIITNQSNSPDVIYLFEPTVNTKTKGFLDMIIRMFTFRIPYVPDIPQGILSFIEFLNVTLLLYSGLIFYRLIRHGGG